MVFDTSADGRSVVFFREDPERRQRNLALMLVDGDGSNVQQVGPWIAEQFCCTASWSPDGSTILTSKRELFVIIAAEGSALTTMNVDVDEYHFVFGPDWSPLRGEDRPT